MPDSRRWNDSNEATYRSAALDVAAEREAHRQSGGGSAAPSGQRTRSPLASRARIPSPEERAPGGMYGREAHLVSQAASTKHVRQGKPEFRLRSDPDALRARPRPDYRDARAPRLVAGIDHTELMRKLAEAAEKYGDAGSLRPDGMALGALGKLLSELQSAREQFQGGSRDSGGERSGGPSGALGSGDRSVTAGDGWRPGMRFGGPGGVARAPSGGGGLGGGFGSRGLGWPGGQGAGPRRGGLGANIDDVTGTDYWRTLAGLGQGPLPLGPDPKKWDQDQDDRTQEDAIAERLEAEHIVAVGGPVQESAGRVVGSEMTAERLGESVADKTNTEILGEFLRIPPPPPDPKSSNPNPDDPYGPVGPWVRTASTNVVHGMYEAIPNPEDHGGGPGPVGPWSRGSSRGVYGPNGREARPNYEGTGGPGPIGPWSRGALGSLGSYRGDIRPNPVDDTGPVGPGS